jgi:hypothetical protein
MDIDRPPRAHDSPSEDRCEAVLDHAAPQLGGKTRDGRLDFAR